MSLVLVEDKAVGLIEAIIDSALWLFNKCQLLEIQTAHTIWIFTYLCMVFLICNKWKSNNIL